MCQVLIQQPDYQAARNYWKVLKNRLNKEGSESVTKCNRLKLVVEDGKMRITDVADYFISCFTFPLPDNNRCGVLSFIIS